MAAPSAAARSASVAGAAELGDAPGPALPLWDRVRITANAQVHERARVEVPDLARRLEDLNRATPDGAGTEPAVAEIELWNGATRVARIELGASRVRWQLLPAAGGPGAAAAAARSLLLGDVQREQWMAALRAAVAAR